MLAYFRLFIGLPGIISHDGNPFWLITRRGEPGNYVLQTRFSERESNYRIDETLRQIGQYSDQLDWMVFPECQPADLGKRLEAREMTGGPGGIWMLADSGSIAIQTRPKHFRVALVQDSVMLDSWRDISAAGFASDISVHYEAYLRHGFTEQAISLHYLAYVQDQPVSSGTLLLAGGIAGIWDVSTPAAMRGRGYASALSQAMLQVAYQRGYQHAWVWSSQMGQSVYARVGFVARDFGIREYSWIRP